MPKIFPALLLVSILVASVGCTAKQEKKDEPPGTQNVAESFELGDEQKQLLPVDEKVNADSSSTIDEINDIDTSNWLTYRNEEYGFELLFPLTWKDYIVTSDGQRNVKNYDFRNYTGEYFSFKHPKVVSSHGQHGSVGFSIGIFNKENWRLVQGMRKLGETSLFIVGSYPNNDAVPDDLLDRYKEISIILGTFKFNNTEAVN